MPVGVALGGSLGGALISAVGANSAAKTQASAANKATAVEQKALDQTQENLQPFMGTGQSAAETLGAFYGLSPTGSGQTGVAYNPQSLAYFQQSPDYQFALDQGLQGVNAGRAAAGGLDSGKTLKSLTSYAEGLASTNLGSYLDRLSGLANMGSTAAGQSGNAALSTARDVGENILGAGSANAAGTIGTTRAINSGLGDIVSTLGQQYGMQNGTSYAASAGAGLTPMGGMPYSSAPTITSAGVTGL